jgi:hypothetical protein
MSISFTRDLRVPHERRRPADSLISANGRVPMRALWAGEGMARRERL